MITKVCGRQANTAKDAKRRAKVSQNKEKMPKNYEVKANTAKDSQIANACAKDGKRR